MSDTYNKIYERYKQLQPRTISQSKVNAEALIASIAEYLDKEKISSEEINLTKEMKKNETVNQYVTWITVFILFLIMCVITIATNCGCGGEELPDPPPQPVVISESGHKSGNNGPIPPFPSSQGYCGDKICSGETITTCFEDCKPQLQNNLSEWEKQLLSMPRLIPIPGPRPKGE